MNSAANPPKGQRRKRIFFGTCCIFLFLFLYVILAITLAQSIFIRESYPAVKMFYYAVLGLAWIIPMMPFIRWMESSPKSDVNGTPPLRQK